MDKPPFDGGDNGVDEVVRILHTLADRIDRAGTTSDTPLTVLDVNGNWIGEALVVDDDGWVIDD